MKRKLILTTIYFLLIFLFAYTATSKLLDHIFFNSQLINFPLLKYAAPLISWTVPFIEFGVVILLLFPGLRLLGLYASLSVLSLFTAYLVVMTVWDEDLPCTCGGVLTYMTWKEHIVFNFFFIAISLAGIILHRHISAPNYNYERRFSS